MYDPYIDEGFPFNVYQPHLFFIGTKHSEFNSYEFPKGSVVLDPWRYMSDQEDVEVIRIGE